MAFISVEAFPELWRNPNIIFIFKTFLWIIASVFVWFRKNWAARLLALLASIYFVGDILFEIPKLPTNIDTISEEFSEISNIAPYVILLSMLIESLFLICFMYYGFFKNSHKGIAA